MIFIGYDAAYCLQGGIEPFEGRLDSVCDFLLQIVVANGVLRDLYRSFLHIWSHGARFNHWSSGHGGRRSSRACYELTAWHYSTDGLTLRNMGKCRISVLASRENMKKKSFRAAGIITFGIKSKVKSLKSAYLGSRGLAFVATLVRYMTTDKLRVFTRASTAAEDVQHRIVCVYFCCSVCSWIPDRSCCFKTISPAPLLLLLPYLYVTPARASVRASAVLLPAASCCCMTEHDCRNHEANLTPPLECSQPKREQKRGEVEAKETTTVGMKDGSRRRWQ